MKFIPMQHVYKTLKINRLDDKDAIKVEQEQLGSTAGSEWLPEQSAKCRRGSG